MQLTFHVPQEKNGALLRDFMRACGVSASMIKQVKTAGGFYKNGVPVHTNERLMLGDAVSFALPPEKDTSVQPELLPFDILYESVHSMVINKAAGQTVHPTRGYVHGTLANAFCGEMQRRGASAVFRPVNRIDRNTSGLVLCAMNAYAAPLLAKYVQKEYFALVQGTLPLGCFVIDAPIAPACDSIIARCVSQAGKPSVTRCEVLACAGGYALIKAIPVTGRTHQIRVHLSSLGYPLAGDDLYGGSTQEIARHALHCGAMRFQEPSTQTRVCARAPLPEDMRTLAHKAGIQLPASCERRGTALESY